MSVCPFCNDPKQVQEMEDEDLLHAYDTCNFRILFEELAKRYNNKKKECEILRAQTDRAIRDLQKVTEGLGQSLKSYQAS